MTTSTSTVRVVRAVTLDDRPVHTYTLSNDIEYIKPKARVY